MHEIGVVIEVVKTVEEFARTNGVTKIDTIVLQIGELSSMIPKYVQDCYPAAVYKTSLEETKLKIEILPGNAICHDCNNVFNLLQNKNECPVCKSKDMEVISGKEFYIKEIIGC